jgi:hypothetical protein
MQCAARSMPAQRRRPARLDSVNFEPTLSVEAASRRRSSSGCSPAKPPKSVAPVDSTAARSRSTIDSAVASETPAPSYVFALPPKRDGVYGPGRALPQGDLQSCLPAASRATRPAIGPEGTEEAAKTFPDTGKVSATLPLGRTNSIVATPSAATPAAR